MDPFLLYLSECKSTFGKTLNWSYNIICKYQKKMWFQYGSHAWSPSNPAFVTKIKKFKQRMQKYLGKQNEYNKSRPYYKYYRVRNLW